MNVIASECPGRMSLANPTAIPKPWSRSTGLFVAVSVFLATQAYTVPIIPMGPWALWPRLADVSFVFVLLIWMFGPSIKIASANSKQLCHALWLLVGGLFVSFSVFTLVLPNISSPIMFSNESIGFGAYGLIRMAEFALVATAAARIPFNTFRNRSVTGLASAVLVVSVVGCLLTFFSIVTTESLSPWLPTGESAGAWWAYQRRIGQGLGAIGYNHGYVSAHILILLAFVLQNRTWKTFWIPSLLVVASGTAIFLSGSRSGLLSFSVFALALVWRRSALERLITVLSALLTALWLFASIELAADPNSKESIVTRQMSAFRPTDTENLSGRTDIWSTAINSFIDAKPTGWLFGMGFGRAMDTGGSTHMLVLQYMLEFGFLGLFLILFAIGMLLRMLWRISSGNRSMFWATVALLFGSFSQETFYPATWTGHFLGLYLVLVVLTFNMADSSLFGSQRTPGLTPIAGSEP